jgi:hypothetical protein
LCGRNADIDLEALEEIPQAFKELEESIIA